MTIFDCLNEVISWKRGDLMLEEDFDKVWNNFMIIKFLTFSKNKDIKLVGLECANNDFYKFTKEELYLYLLTAIKKTPFGNIKYSKKPEKKKAGKVEVEEDMVIEFGKKSKPKKAKPVETENPCSMNIFNMFD